MQYKFILTIFALSIPLIVFQFALLSVILLLKKGPTCQILSSFYFINFILSE